MKMNRLVIALFILFSACNMGERSGSNKARTFHIEFYKDLTVAPSDSLLLFGSSRESELPSYFDSSNSFCHLSGDTLKMYLRTSKFEGSSALDLQVIRDQAYTNYRVLDRHNNYDYSIVNCQIRLGKRSFQVGDYINMQVTGVVIGRVQKNANETNDTVKFQGKIRLKIRDSSFSFEDFFVENEREAFYALMNSRPDTVKKISLYGCSYNDLPKELALFPNLEELDLNGNDLNRADFSVLEHLRKLKSINLANCNLSEIPLAVFSLECLKQLNVWDNNIKDIPDALFAMRSLTHLTIGNNPVSSLSPKLSLLENLELLETSSSGILYYPEELSRLKKLKEIYPNDTMLYVPKTLVKFVWGCDTILNRN
jgi:hypothetical protein